MKKLVAVLILGLLTMVGCAERRNSASSGGAAATGQATGAKAESIDRLNDSAQVLKELANAPDNVIPNEVLAKAKCVAVVPSMIKGGFVFGGQHGRGVATCRTSNGWSAPAFFTMTGGSWGAQIGAESVDVVMLIMNDKGGQDLLSSNFKLGAEAGVAAGPVGREAQASTDWKLKAEVLTYSRTRGLFAGLDLSGAAIRPDDDSTTAFYGRNYDFRNVLTGGVKAPPVAQPFLASGQSNLHYARATSDQRERRTTPYRGLHA